MTDFYHPNDEGGILWKDETIGIQWPMPEGMTESGKTKTASYDAVGGRGKGRTRQKVLVENIRRLPREKQVMARNFLDWLKEQKPES